MMPPEECQLWEEYRANPGDLSTARVLQFYEKRIQRQVAKLAVRSNTTPTVSFSYSDIDGEVRRGYAEAIPDFKPECGRAFHTFANQRATWAFTNFLRQANKLTKTDIRDGVRIVDPNILSPDRDLKEWESFLVAKGGAPGDAAGFWKKVYHRTRDHWKGRLVLNLLYREHWTFEECAKYFDVAEGTIREWRNQVVRILSASVSLQKWLRDGTSRRGRCKPCTSHKANIGEAFVIRNNGRPCVTAGCDKPIYLRGRCYTCYRARLNQEKVGDEIVCEVTGCREPVRCRKLCKRHYMQLFLNGAFLPPDSPKCKCGNKRKPESELCFRCLNSKQASECNSKRRDDPAFREKRRAQQRARRKKKILTPEQREKSKAYKERYYQANKEKANEARRLLKQNRRVLLKLPVAAETLAIAV
jgi:hypothetical protein